MERYQLLIAFNWNITNIQKNACKKNKFTYQRLIKSKHLEKSQGQKKKIENCQHLTSPQTLPNTTLPELTTILTSNPVI